MHHCASSDDVLVGFEDLFHAPRLSLDPSRVGSIFVGVCHSNTSLVGTLVDNRHCTGSVIPDLSDPSRAQGAVEEDDCD